MNWVEYLSQIFRFAGVEITEDIRLYHPGAEMIYGVLNLVKKTDPKIVKNFALLRVFLFQAPDSDTSTRKAFEDYYNAKGYQLYPRWEYCTRKLLDVIDTATLSYAITYDYQLYHYDINKISEVNPPVPLLLLIPSCRRSHLCKTSATSWQRHWVRPNGWTHNRATPL
jgi:hypothetical protein